MTDAKLREAVIAKFGIMTEEHEWIIALVVARCAEAIEAIHRSDDADPWSDGFGVGLDEALTTTRALAPQEPSHD